MKTGNKIRDIEHMLSTSNKLVPTESHPKMGEPDRELKSEFEIRAQSSVLEYLVAIL